MKSAQEYISSSQQWKNIYSRHKETWSFVEKVPITKIKIDTRLFSYPNKVNLSHVNDIIQNIENSEWPPILVNEDYYLLDGQHRLEAAKRMKLKYIDVVIQHVENYSYYYRRLIKKLPENQTY